MNAQEAKQLSTSTLPKYVDEYNRLTAEQLEKAYRLIKGASEQGHFMTYIEPSSNMEVYNQLEKDGFEIIKNDPFSTNLLSSVSVSWGVQQTEMENYLSNQVK